MEKLSPILAFYVADGVARGAERSSEILKYGGMGHTAGVHTRSREVAVRFGAEMPASRITVNTPTTHGAIGFSTALPPSMTLGCGSWGGNVTSDNISPLHLMDIKRVAFETRPVKSKRPATSVSTTATPAPVATERTRQAPAVIGSGAGQINRQEIAAIVDRFLAGRRPEEFEGRQQPATEPSAIEPEAGSMYTGSAQAARQSDDTRSSNRGSESRGRAEFAGKAPSGNSPQSAANGHKTVDFVSEDDVRRAIQKGEKIYINAKTIITPAARDIAEPAEVFAKG